MLAQQTSTNISQEYTQYTLTQIQLPKYKQYINAEWGSQTLKQACYRENPESAMCVQNLNDSRGLAIRITYRISLRSSSLWEPRHPPLKVVSHQVLCTGRCWHKAQHRTNRTLALGHLGLADYQNPQITNKVFTIQKNMDGKINSPNSGQHLSLIHI